MLEFIRCFIPAAYGIIFRLSILVADPLNYFTWQQHHQILYFSIIILIPCCTDDGLKSIFIISNTSHLRLYVYAIGLPWANTCCLMDIVGQLFFFTKIFHVTTSRSQLSGITYYFCSSFYCILIWMMSRIGYRLYFIRSFRP